MAEWLTIAPATVRTHRQHVIDKLGARNVAHAVLLGIATGAYTLADVHAAL